MQLRIIAPNQIELGFDNGLNVFFNYETPVAAYVPGTGWIRTGEPYDKTVSKHIDTYLHPTFAAKVPQLELESIVDNWTKPCLKEGD